MKKAIATSIPCIDPVLFERQLKAFRRFVEQKSRVSFVSFENSYVEKEEGYKARVYLLARDALAVQSWVHSDIGSGEIIERTIAAIEILENNFVPWQARHGDKRRPHQPLFEAKKRKHDLRRAEELLFGLYRAERDAQTFGALARLLGKTYPLIGYLFFIKDRSRYLPIAPSYFDRAFELLGANFKTSRRCSWENYSAYLSLIGELRNVLTEDLEVEVTLLDAHSFAWILACQMQKEGKLADVSDYLDLPSSEREAIIKARIGQGRFRDSLVEYWSHCAVTGCVEEALLSASHIKPWKYADLTDRLSLYNGLLLSPALDACFDRGYISFDDDGRILISKRLRKDDARVLGIHRDMSLRRVDRQHKKYLAFHRSKIFN